MIKCENNEVTIKGYSIDILAEFGAVTISVLRMLENGDIPREKAVEVVRRTVEFGIENAPEENSEKTREKEARDALFKLIFGGGKDAN